MRAAAKHRARLKEVAHVVEQFVAREKRVPTTREVADLLNLRSASSAQGWLSKAAAAGLLIHHPRRSPAFYPRRKVRRRTCNVSCGVAQFVREHHPDIWREATKDMPVSSTDWEPGFVLVQP